MVLAIYTGMKAITINKRGKNMRITISTKNLLKIAVPITGLVYLGIKMYGFFVALGLLTITQ